jgi:hypothetical protein
LVLEWGQVMDLELVLELVLARDQVLGLEWVHG